MYWIKSENGYVNLALATDIMIPHKYSDEDFIVKAYFIDGESTTLAQFKTEEDAQKYLYNLMLDLKAK